jgi:hypothetical protein
MVQRSESICDVDQGYITKDRSGMVVIGLSNDEMRASFKMTPACFERFYQDLTKFWELNLRGSRETTEK